MLPTRTVETSVSQRTISVLPKAVLLSSLIRNLIVDELLCKVMDFGISYQGYADDTAIIGRGKFEGTLCEIIQPRLEITNKWYLSVGSNGYFHI